MVGGRKDWLTSGMEERKRRRELGMPEIYLYGKNTRSVSYTDFVNKELILFSNADNERSIPSLVDGKSTSSLGIRCFPVLSASMMVLPSTDS